MRGKEEDEDEGYEEGEDAVIMLAHLLGYNEGMQYLKDPAEDVTERLDAIIEKGGIEI